jgi:uncharacterized membrane protein YbhN (UPF0104 family)
LKIAGRLTRATAGVVVGVVLTWLLLYSTGNPAQAVARIGTSLASSDHRIILAAFGLFALSQVLRALRWRILSFRNVVPFSLSMPVTSIHVGLGHLLPVRLSDVAFVGLFRKFGGIPVGDGTATVILAKLQDVLAMGIVIGAAVLSGVSGRIILLAPILIAAGASGVFILPVILSLLSGPVHRIFTGKWSRIPVWFDDLKEASSVRGRRGRFFTALALSILAWTSKLFMFTLLLRAIGVAGIPLWKILFASGVTDLTMALPVHGLLSLGTVEAGWTAGFAIVGVEGIVGSGFSILEAGFCVHILWLSMAVILMLPAVPWLLLSHRRKMNGNEPLG